MDDLEDLEDDHLELDGNEGVDFEDLLLDEDEFPLGSDIEDYIAMVHEVIDELSCYHKLLKIFFSHNYKIFHSIGTVLCPFLCFFQSFHHLIYHFKLCHKHIPPYCRHVS